MLYLFFQTWAWIIGAFILGLLCGWWICGRCNCKSSDADDADLVAPVAPVTVKKDAETKIKKAPAAPVKQAVTKKSTAKKSVVNIDDVKVDDAWKPKGFASKPTDADDLKKVKGIGPVIEKTLNGLGIYQFKQIASFDKDNIAWVNKHISFAGRIEREEWVSQAKKLS